RQIGAQPNGVQQQPVDGAEWDRRMLVVWLEEGCQRPVGSGDDEGPLVEVEGVVARQPEKASARDEGRAPNDPPRVRDAYVSRVHGQPVAGAVVGAESHKGKALAVTERNRTAVSAMVAPRHAFAAPSPPFDEWPAFPKPGLAR